MPKHPERCKVTLSHMSKKRVLVALSRRNLLWATDWSMVWTQIALVLLLMMSLVCFKSPHRSVSPSSFPLAVSCDLNIEICAV